MATPVNDKAQLDRSISYTRSSPPPCPVTPLRSLSRTSLRSRGSSHNSARGTSSTFESPLGSLEVAFGEISDSMADLEANCVHLQLMHESLSRFNECFASFLYGLNVNAFCVDFPEAPVLESFMRSHDTQQVHKMVTLDEGAKNGLSARPNELETGLDGDQTFLTTDTTFIENPPSFSAKVPSNNHDSQRSTSIRRGMDTTNLTRGGRGAAFLGTAPSGVVRGRRSGLARPTTGRGRRGPVR